MSQIAVSLIMQNFVVKREWEKNVYRCHTVIVLPMGTLEYIWTYNNQWNSWHLDIGPVKLCVISPVNELILVISCSKLGLAFTPIVFERHMMMIKLDGAFVGVTLAKKEYIHFNNWGKSKRQFQIPGNYSEVVLHQPVLVSERKRRHRQGSP